MAEFTISFNDIFWFCSFIAALYGILIILKYILKSNDDLKETVAKHDNLLDKDNKRLMKIEDSNQMILKCLLVIINNDITGNGIEKMKQARGELQEFLINK